MDSHLVLNKQSANLQEWISNRREQNCTIPYNSCVMPWALSSSELFLSLVVHLPSVRLNFSHFYILQNHSANFNQTWHKATFGLKFIQMKGPSNFQGEIIKKYCIKNALTEYKNPHLQNHWVNLNTTWHKASLDEGDQIWQNKDPTLFQGEIITK